MVSYKNDSRDSFGCLLNNLPSIDSSLFEHKSLRDVQQTKASNPESSQAMEGPSQLGSMGSPGSAGPHGTPVSQTGRGAEASNLRSVQGAYRSFNSVPNKVKNGNAASQFDVLLEDLPSTRQSR